MSRSIGQFNETFRSNSRAVSLGAKSALGQTLPQKSSGGGLGDSLGRGIGMGGGLGGTMNNLGKAPFENDIIVEEDEARETEVSKVLEKEK